MATKTEIMLPNGREKIVFSITEYRGQKRVDSRTYFVNAAGEWCPTKKGWNVPLSLLTTMQNSFNRLEESDAA